MKSLKQYIREEVQRLSEVEYDAPPEILDTLKQLRVEPVDRYVSHFKAVNSIPPSYEVYLHNGEFFTLIFEQYSMVVKVGHEEHWLGDVGGKNEATKDINRLLTGPKMRPKKGEEGEEGEGEGGLPPLPSPPKGASAPKPPSPPKDEPSPEPEPKPEEPEA